MNVCRSHDRALPEIPASASGVASTDDDDEEDEGHYDVISKSRRAAAAANMQPNSQTRKPRFCHPYEIVAGDSDPTYAGIREELEAVISLRNSRGRMSNPRTAAVAHEVSDPLYAGITDDTGAGTQALPSVVALRSRIPATYSAAASNPQVQRLHAGDHVVEPEGTVTVVEDVESPLLPPRNGNIDSVDGATSAAVCSASSARPQMPAAVSTNDGSDITAAAADPSVQELQLLHNSASADAMPVSGTRILS